MTKVQLDDVVEDFNKRLAAVDDMQEELELEISDSNLLQKDIKIADEFHREVRALRVLSAQILVDFDKNELVEQQSAAHSDSCVSLPKIELLKFKAARRL